MKGFQLLLVRQMTTRPTVISNRNLPKPFKLEKGKKYAWCTCGQSSKQPMCDGSHRGSGFVPIRFVAEESKTALMCCCKNTNNGPLCDMTHIKVLMDNTVGRFRSTKTPEAGDAPLVSARLPTYQSLTEGKTYLWCACGASKTQPFCDGSHSSGSIKPVSFTAEKTKSRLNIPFPGGCVCANKRKPLHSATQPTWMWKFKRRQKGSQCQLLRVTQQEMYREHCTMYISHCTGNTINGIGISLGSIIRIGFGRFLSADPQLCKAIRNMFMIIY
eukprot:sb/3468128/